MAKAILAPRIATIIDAIVSAGSKPIGRPGRNASMATKCVAQTPAPATVAAAQSQGFRPRLEFRRAREARLRAVAQDIRQIKAARTTSLGSCRSAMQA